MERNVLAATKLGETQLTEALRQVISQSPVVLHPARYAVLQVENCPDPRPHFLVCHEADEITVITTEQEAQRLSGVRQREQWFRLLEFRMSTPFATPGFLATISQAIAARGLNQLLVSTFSKDWLLLREEDLSSGWEILGELGFPRRGWSEADAWRERLPDDQATGSASPSNFAGIG